MITDERASEIALTIVLERSGPKRERVFRGRVLSSALSDIVVDTPAASTEEAIDACVEAARTRAPARTFRIAKILYAWRELPPASSTRA